MPTQARQQERPTVVKTNFLTGLAVTAVASVIFLALSALGLEGCDRSDGLAAAWGIAVVVDIVSSAVLLVLATRRYRGQGRAVMIGWALSLVPKLVLASAAIIYINALPSGCGA